jgi:hypothetical protein
MHAGLGFVRLGSGTYFFNSAITLTSEGAFLSGEAQGTTKIKFGHTGDAVRLKGEYQKVSKLTITSDATREALAYGTDCFGIRLEADLDTDRMRNTYIGDVVIEKQNTAGIYGVGPVLDGSTIERVRVLNNKGHAFAFDLGYLAAGADRAILPVGVLNIQNCLAFGNTGHAVACGHPSSTTTTQSVRVVIDNLDANVSSMDTAQLYGTNDHAYWLAGTGIKLKDCVATGDGTQYSVSVQGTNNIIDGLRQVEMAASVEVVDNVAPLPTSGIEIKRLNVVNTTAQTNAVILTGTSLSEITIKPAMQSDITNIVDTYDVEGLSIEYQGVLRVSTADTTINNSTSLVDVNSLRYYLGENRDIEFEATLYFTGTATADARFSLGGPAGADVVLFGSGSNTKLGGSDTVDIADTETAFGDVFAAGASANTRAVKLSGIIKNGSTAGAVTVRAAQLSAEVSNLTILEGSNLKVTPLWK